MTVPNWLVFFITSQLTALGDDGSKFGDCSPELLGVLCYLGCLVQMYSSPKVFLAYIMLKNLLTGVIHE